MSENNAISVLLSVKDDKWETLWPTAEQDVELVVRRCFKEALSPSLAFLLKRPIEISVVLTNDENIRILNRDYRGKDKPTNVLSFPQISPKDAHMYTDLFMPAGLGDIIAAWETIKKESNQQNKDLRDHLMHLSVHSILHLLGYDHENNADAKLMETTEIKILASMGIKNPYEFGNFVK